MKDLKARVEASTTLNQSFGQFWIPEDSPVDTDTVESETLQTIKYSTGGATHFIEGTEAMGEVMVGKRVPLLGELPEENTSLAFYMAVASRDFKDASGVLRTKKGAERVVLMPAK